MQEIKKAMELTTSHGLPRMVTNKPIYVRIVWLLFFLFMLGLFINGFNEFVVKLKTNPVTTSLEVKAVDFQFPDVYACFCNPISGSYSASLDPTVADIINSKLNDTTVQITNYLSRKNGTGALVDMNENELSFLYPQSLPYSLLADALGHRVEQSVISSGIIHKDVDGTPSNMPLPPSIFYHPVYLRCLRWSLNSTVQDKIVKTSLSSGLMITLLIDTNSSYVPLKGAAVMDKVYAGGSIIPLSDWSLNINEFFGPERSAGVRVFLASPGEYPSEFVTSFSLGPGRRYFVDMEMTQQVYQERQFKDCVSDASDVQFVNPYDQSDPYSHSYSYSYCYYYEYHRQFQSQLNLSGDVSPVPWPLRGKNYVFNITGSANTMLTRSNPLANFESVKRATEKSQAKCHSKRPCTTVEYTVSISSTHWPTPSSLTPFIFSSVKLAYNQAKDKNQSVPALDFLLTGNATDVAHYVAHNVLSMQLKPHKALSDQITFSKDYTISNFVSDVGGIVGVYLGMSLLTLVELLELAYDLVKVFCDHWKKQSASGTSPIALTVVSKGADKPAAS